MSLHMLVVQVVHHTHLTSQCSFVFAFFSLALNKCGHRHNSCCTYQPVASSAFPCTAVCPAIKRRLGNGERATDRTTVSEDNLNT